LDKRVAAIFTYAQLTGEDGIEKLVTLTSEEPVKEFALRALADRKTFIDQVPMEPFIRALNDRSARVQVAAAVGLGRLGRVEAAEALLQVPVDQSFVAPGNKEEGAHSTPNSSIIPAHTAVRALVALNAVDACVQAV